MYNSIKVSVPAQFVLRFHKVSLKNNIHRNVSVLVLNHTIQNQASTLGTLVRNTHILNTCHVAQTHWWARTTL